MINVNIGVNASKALQDLTRIEQQIIKLTSKTHNINVNINSNTLSADIGKAVDNAIKKSVSKNKTTTTTSTNNILDSPITLTRNLSQAYAKSVTDYAVRFNRTLDSFNGMKTGINKITTGFTTLNSGIKQVTSGFRDLLLPAIMLVSKVMNESVEQMKAGARLSSVYLGKSSENKEITKLARSISNSTGVSTKDVQMMGYEFLSAGGDRTLLRDIMKLSAVASQAGFVQDKQGYMKSLATTGNVYNAKTIEDFYAIANGISYMDRSSVMTADKFATYASRELVAFKQAGLTLNEMFASLTTMSINAGAQGIPQALSQLLSKSNKPTNKGFTVMEDRGLDFYNDISTSGLKKKGLVKYIEDIKKSMGELNDDALIAIDNMYGSKGAGKAFELLSENLDTLKASMKDLEKNDSLSQQWEAFQQTDYFKYLKMTERLKNSFASLGDTLMPIFIEIGNTIANVIEKISNFISKNEELTSKIVKGIAIFAIFAGVMFIVSAVAKIVGGAFTILSGIFGIISGLCLLVASGFTLITGAVGVTAGVVAIVGAGFLAFGYIIWFVTNNSTGLIDGLKMTFYMFAGSALTILQALAVGLKSSLKVGEMVAEGLASAMAHALNFIVDNIQRLLLMMADLTGEIPIVGSMFDNMANSSLKWNISTEFDFDFTSGIDEVIDLINKGQDKIDKEMEEIAGGELKKNPFVGIIDKIKEMFDPEDLKPDFDPNEFLEELMDNGFGDLGEFVPGTGIDDLLDDLYGDKNDDALKKQKQLIESMADSIKSLADGYSQAVDMLDKYTKKVINSNTIMKNSRTAKSVVLEWAEVQSKLLNNSGLSSELKAYISQMKPDQLAELKAISKLSSAELAEFDSNYKTILSTSKASANANIINIEIQKDKDDKSYKQLADDIIKELKRRGVKLS